MVVWMNRDGWTDSLYPSISQSTFFQSCKMGPGFSCKNSLIQSEAGENYLIQYEGCKNTQFNPVRVAKHSFIVV